MKCVLYSSFARDGLTEAELRDILRVSVRHNAAQGITGVLLFGDALFLQVLEGPEEAVEALIAAIAADPRNHGLRRIIDETVHERHFAEWAMAYAQLEQLPPEERAHCRRLADATPSNAAGPLSPEIKNLFTLFRSLLTAA